MTKSLAGIAGRICVLAVLVPVLALAGGCSRTDTTSGVENLWRAPGFKAEVGRTTEADVLAALGPPSQLINLKNETVYYYLKEHFRSDRLLLILYNRTERATEYDRAIFFFGPDGVLTKASFSDTSLDGE